MREFLFNLGVGKGFLTMTQNPCAIKEKSDRCYYNKIILKTTATCFLGEKKTPQSQRRNENWKKNICEYKAFPTYKEILKIKVKKRSELNRKLEKHMNRQFTKSIYKHGPKA